MIPQNLDIPRSSDGAIEIQPYQPVTFAFRQVANLEEKLEASSVTVLLSSTPLKDLGNWLGGERNQEQFEESFHDHEEQGTFVIDHTSKQDEPFRVKISLPQ